MRARGRARGAGLTCLGLLLSHPALAGDRAPIGGVKLVQPVRFPVSRDFGVRVLVPPSDATVRMQGPQALARRSIGGAVIDFYPLDDHFHVSAGGKLSDRGGAKSSDPASLQSLAAARPAGGIRQGRRFTPTMLMGYSIDGSHGMTLGVDAGVMMGQATPAPRMRLTRGPHGTEPTAPDGLNPLARVTMRYPF